MASGKDPVIINSSLAIGLYYVVVGILFFLVERYRVIWKKKPYISGPWYNTFWMALWLVILLLPFGGSSWGVLLQMGSVVGTLSVVDTLVYLVLFAVIVLVILRSVIKQLRDADYYVVVGATPTALQESLHYAFERSAIAHEGIGEEINCVSVGACIYVKRDNDTYRISVEPAAQRRPLQTIIAFMKEYFAGHPTLHNTNWNYFPNLSQFVCPVTLIIIGGLVTFIVTFTSIGWISHGISAVAVGLLLLILHHGLPLWGGYAKKKVLELMEVLRDYDACKAAPRDIQGISHSYLQATGEKLERLAFHHLIGFTSIKLAQNFGVRNYELIYVSPDHTTVAAVRPYRWGALMNLIAFRFIFGPENGVLFVSASSCGIKLWSTVGVSLPETHVSPWTFMLNLPDNMDVETAYTKHREKLAILCKEKKLDLICFNLENDYLDWMKADMKRDFDYHISSDEAFK